MIRKNILTRALIGVLALVLAAPVGVFAQPAPNPPGEGAPQSMSQAQLDQMLAPVALYPDSLLAQVLLASTYPSQVVEAYRWERAHRGWSKARINAALDKRDWDLSVKALVPFPKVLAMMNKHLDWTTNLGEAFLANQGAVMAQVQVMRQKAYAKGNLKTTPQQKVVVANNDIEIEPVNPQVIYVPYYNPLLVYGPWWWPGYPPYAFYPYGGPFITFGLFGFAAAIAVGPFWNWGWGHWGWNSGNVYVNANRNANINGRNPGFNRSTMRTANFHSLARHQVAGLGRVNGAHHGAFNRPSAGEVRRGLSRGGGSAANRHGAGAAAHHGAGAAAHHGARTGSFARGPAHVNHGVSGGFRGRGFAGAHPGHAAPGFGGGGFRGFGGGGAHFGGGAAHFGGGGFRGFGGGGAHFGGGGAHFGGGGAHFGGGHFGGGGHGGGGHRR